MVTITSSVTYSRLLIGEANALTARSAETIAEERILAGS